ncbi:hypothetical protein ACHAWF_014371 [Thalassiosira exigua]
MKVAEYLLDVDDPTEDIKEAIVGAYIWAKKSVLLDYAKEKDFTGNTILVYSEGAMLWLRFATISEYPELAPIFCDRGYTVTASLMYNEYPAGYSQMDPECRNGYTWLGSWGFRVIEQFESKWNTMHPYVWPNLDEYLATKSSPTKQHTTQPSPSIPSPTNAPVVVPVTLMSSKSLTKSPTDAPSTYSASASPTSGNCLSALCIDRCIARYD